MSLRNQSIEKNGKKIEIPNTWNDFIDLMTLQEIKFDSIKRNKFEENSSLIKLLDSYLQEQYSNGSFILPELKTMGNGSIAIFSDYGGEHKESKYNSYSLLFCGWNHSYPVGDTLKELRNKHCLNKNEISFKNLEYGPTSRALDEYLDILDKNVHGFLLTVLIDKEIGPLFIGKQNEHLLKEIEDIGLGNWHKKTAEKLMRITHLIGYILPLIADSNQKIIWMSDKDPIIQNSSMFSNALELLPKVFKIYSDNEYKRLNGAKLPFDDKDIYTMDLLSITDLVAGSVEQYFSEEKKFGKPFVKIGAEKVIKWLVSPGDFLKKEVVRLSKKDNTLKIEGITFNKNLKRP